MISPPPFFHFSFPHRHQRLGSFPIIISNLLNGQDRLFSPMAEFENSVEFSGKSKPSTTGSFFFNRSLTLNPSITTATAADSSPKSHHQTGLERSGSGSFTKFYSSFESVRSASNSFKGKVKKLCSFFETPNSIEESQTHLPSKLKPGQKQPDSEFRVSLLSPDISCPIRLPGTGDRIVVYFTSLRGVRRTYEDCYSVRMIFRGFRVWVDERDVSLDSAYKKELQSVLSGETNGNKNGKNHSNLVTLPQVFIRGKHIGGAETVKHLFETGELAKLLEGFPVQKLGFSFGCDSCGDVRFAPCTNCNGSRKVFDEEEDRVQRCLECNENGLIRCPDCSS